MKVTLSDVSEIKKRVAICVPKEKVNEEIEATYKELKKKAQVKGFRPGKTPKNILRAYFHKQVHEDVSQKLIKDLSKQALDENKLSPLYISDPEKGELTPDNDFDYSFEIEIKPTFTVNYDDLKYEEKEMKVTEKDIDDVIESSRNRLSILTEIKDRNVINNGDFADVEIKEENKEKRRVTIEIGKGLYYKEFEEKLVNLTVGSEQEISIRYPDNCSNKDLCGKEKNYFVRIYAIKEKILPAIDDELARSCGDYESLAEMRKEIEERLKKNIEVEKENDIKNQIATQLIEKNQFAVPDSLLDLHKTLIVNDRYRNLERLGYKMTREHVKDSFSSDEVTEKATKNAKIELIFTAIAEKNNVSVSDEEVDKSISKIAETYKIAYNDLLKNYRTTGLYDDLKSSILENKIMDFLKGNIDKSGGNK